MTRSTKEDALVVSLGNQWVTVPFIESERQRKNGGSPHACVPACVQ